jgi:hypothetical protein
MAAQTIQITMHFLHSAGLAVTLTPERGLKASPASAITDTMRALIRANKVEIVAYLADAANDPAPTSAMDRLRAASLALDAVIAASGMEVNPDRWCFPHSDAMNTREIDAFATRLALFNRQGVTMAQAEALALQLVERDRSMDSRRLCVECSHLIGSRCNNWQAADVAIRFRDAFLPVELVRKFQLCSGFNVAGSVRWP